MAVQPAGRRLVPALLGMPMAQALGGIAGLLESIPFLGPIESAALAVLVAFTQGPER
ncbi:MAG: hypothetical protein M3Y32_12300 [Pseudomonadota bacterium]|nr:hypothetical protein [Pseudomonadota bacterium]